MNHEAKKYLQEVSRGLINVSKEDEKDILLEIKNHIHEACEQGESTAQTLARFGSPDNLAKAYSFGFSAKNQKLKPTHIMKNFMFYGSVGFSGFLVVPLLCILAITFLMVGTVIPGTAVLNLIGVTQIPMFVWGEASIPPGLLQLALSIAAGAFFIWLVWLCWRGLKEYIKAISAKYRKLTINK